MQPTVFTENFKSVYFDRDRFGDHLPFEKHLIDINFRSVNPDNQ